MTPAERVADGAAAVSVSAATMSWVSEVNALLQLVATVVAIIAGIFAIIVHWRRLQR